MNARRLIQDYVAAPSAGMLCALLLAAITLTSPVQAQITFSNTTPIVINDNPPGDLDGTAASPYPSTIVGSGLTGTITGITVSLFDFDHTFPDDVAALFVGPADQRVKLFDGPGSNANGTETVRNPLDWTFDDAAGSTLPDTGTLVSGTFRPGQNQHNDNLPMPAPQGSYALNFGALIGANPNGTYSLYLADFLDGDFGAVQGGWSITLSGVSVTATPEPGTVALALTALPLAAFAVYRRRRRSARRLS